MNIEQRLAEAEPIIARTVRRVAHTFNEQAQEDARQEARVKVWQRLQREPDATDAMLGATSRQAAIDLLVNGRRPTGAPSNGTQRHYEQAATLDLTALTDAVEAAADNGGASRAMPRTLVQSDETDAIDLRVLVEPILGTLSERDRQLVHLLYWEDKTQAEAATALDLTREHVSRLLSRTILPTLRDALG